MRLIVRPDGTLQCLYHETLDLHLFGTLQIQRASHVEPNEHGNWFADLSPVGGPKLGPFSQRSRALSAEEQWLHDNWLT